MEGSWIQTAIEFYLGICSGAAASAGVFALITVIGIIPRLAGFTRTARHIHKYEWAVILGGSICNIWYFFRPEFMFVKWMGVLGETVIGLAVGMFVGSLAMALTEVLQVFPIIIRRTRLRAGVRFLSLAMALGKAAGALLYFAIK